MDDMRDRVLEIVRQRGACVEEERGGILKGVLFGGKLFYFTAADNACAGGGNLFRIHSRQLSRWELPASYWPASTKLRANPENLPVISILREWTSCSPDQFWCQGGRSEAS